MRFALAVLLALHGVVHLIGLGQERQVRFAWVFACCVLVGAGVLLVVRGPWWPAAAIGVVLSQILIVMAWSDAKAGTVPNVVIAVAVVIAAALAHFERRSGDQIDALLARVPAGPGAIVDRDELRGLPPPVVRWLASSGIVGRPRARVVRLRQRGELRTAPDRPWMPATAEQYFSIDQPGFVWTTSVQMAHVLPVVGRDTYVGGRGRMAIGAAGVVPVVDADGRKIDEGALQRFLGELVWFPSAALAPYVAWAPLDDHAALATMTYGGVSASVTFRFDAADRVVLLEAERYQGADAAARRQHWVIPVTAWHTFEGTTVPSAGEVTWDLATGRFAYFRWQLTALEYDQRARWP